nr:MAG TPA: hypothetical protein [Caudoviricetes sp.]
MVCDMLHRMAWIHNRGTPLPPYIHYYNRAAALACIVSGVAVVSGRPGVVTRSNVAQVVLWPLVSVWYIQRQNGANLRKSPCKALCAVLWHWRYKLH